MDNNYTTVEILLVEDNPADTRLIIEVLKDFKIKNNLNVVTDGVNAMEYLNKEGEYHDFPTPDLILLDLNLPRKDGREVLNEIKHDERFMCIPVVILTTSNTQEDILNAYKSYANCFITKPVDFQQFMNVIHSIEDFWLKIVKLPSSK
jgi:CheY-like chemotaxis protein